MAVWKRVIRFLKNDSPIRLFFAAWNHVIHRVIIPSTPRVHQKCNGIDIWKYRWGEHLHPDYPSENRHRPDYEGGLREVVDEHVNPGDDVCVVGAGAGVITVHASRAAGRNGCVYAFEASEEMIGVAQKTADKNHTKAPIQFIHATVGSSGKVWRGDTDVNVFPVSELPTADICIIDVEGAELDIIPLLPSYPTVAIESHGLFDSPTEIVAEHLEKSGYDIIDRLISEPGQKEMCLEDDVRIIVGKINRDINSQ